MVGIVAGVPDRVVGVKGFREEEALMASARVRMDCQVIFRVGEGLA